MKKIILTISLLSLYFAQAQEQENIQQKQNEFHINALLPIAFKTFEFGYERNLNESSSVGATILIGNEDYYFTDFAFTPYYHMFFSNGYAKGFFLEAFSMINSGNGYDTYVYDDYGGHTIKGKSYTDVALGVGAGGKFITKNNFVGEVSLGIGRNFGKEEFGHEQIVFKGGISLGVRF